MDIDILLIDESTMQVMLSKSKEHQLQGIAFQVPSLLHLIALKLHAILNNPKRKNRDLADIQNLLEIHKDEINSSELKNIVTKFAPPELTEDLMRNIT